MNKKMKSLYALVVLLVSMASVDAHFVTGTYLAIKNESSSPVTFEIRTTIDVPTYSVDEISFAIIHKRMVIQPDETIPTEISIPNTAPIYVSVTADGKKIIDEYVIEQNGFVNKGSTSSERMPFDHADYSYIKGEIWWNGHAANLSPYDPPSSVYLYVNASYYKTRYLW